MEPTNVCQLRLNRAAVILLIPFTGNGKASEPILVQGVNFQGHAACETESMVPNTVLLEMSLAHVAWYIYAFGR